MFPWADLRNSTEEFIAPEYIPDDFQVKDPLKMVMADVDTLIKHWHKRTELEVWPLEFKGYKTKQGEIVPCVVLAIALDNLITMKDSEESSSEGRPQCFW